MSSSNRVELTFIEEAVLGETPAVGSFNTMRFTSESLSGTPTTTESQQIRADRQSSGQVVTGLELTGEVNIELAREPQLDLLLAGAMFSNWDVQALQTVDLQIIASTSRIVRSTGNWNATIDVGDFITLAGFTNTVNNTDAQVVQIVSATEIRVAFNKQNGPVVNETATGTTYKRADRLAIGTTLKSFSIQKAFKDLADKAINYRGMVVGQLNLDMTYGEIVTGTIGFSGTGYQPVDASGDFMTDGRTVNAPATTNSMNGSVDMPILVSALAGTLDEVSFCVQSIGLGLNNNLTARTCIGRIAPAGYAEGTAAVEINLSAYLADDNWDAMALKLSQQPFALGWQIKNVDGWYGFYVPAVQISFDDPASGGANQEISLESSGTGKVGPNGESALYIYRS